MRRLKRAELTLLALALAQGRPLTRIYLQKAVLIIQEYLLENAPEVIEDPYLFQKRKYGGLAPEIYADAISYSRLGLTVVEDLREDGLPFTYSATEKGIQEGLQLLGHIPFSIRELLRGHVEWVEGRDSVRELAQAMYDLFPAYEENSVLKRSPSRVNSPTRRIEAIRPAPIHTPILNALRWMRSATGLSDVQIASILGTTTTQLSIWQQGSKISATDEQRILAVRRVLERIVSRFHTPQAVRAWLNTLETDEMRTPADLIAQGDLDRVRFLALSNPASERLIAPRYDVYEGSSRAAEDTSGHVTPDADIRMDDLFDRPPLKRQGQR